MVTMEQNFFFVLLYLPHLIIECSPRATAPGAPAAPAGAAASTRLNVTEHTLLTEDGYVLTIFRMRGCNYCEKINEIPVLLLHGLLQTSENFLDAGPRAGLPYLLSEACYDLWMPNQRGNRYSRKHTYLDPDSDPGFWDFSLDEMGRYDLPASIDYVLNATGAEALDFIGYSQGTTVFYIMCSERPEYQKRIRLSIVLAPFTSSKHMRSIIFKTLSRTVYALQSLLHRLGIHELLSHGGFTQRVTSALCKHKYAATKICSLSFGLLENHPPRSVSGFTYRLLFSHFPEGTSVNTIAWYGHVLTTGQFQKLDYGRDENLKRYGSNIPPFYNVSSVTVPTAVVYGRGDYLVGVGDVRELLNKLPNVTHVVEIEEPTWNHLDFAYNENINTSYFQTVNKLLLRSGAGAG